MSRICLLYTSQLFQALLAVVQLWPLGPVLQILFQGGLQRLGGELARFHGPVSYTHLVDAADAGKQAEMC